ncbi:DUF2877 domain-containing protein [Actinocorallia sp. API 0066]|uniref:oxamate carbamoyltransferase subunit AllH family protein n=1 Tax=Actinocorallia sp. API 0066 TaxID=2896846 RepID=UPI001E4C53E3|nr:DUF2877 domain-containing protein [Actinocorallia sp. API 0066]MCD0450886.1 DUF2877 domain-containing protein [Actinocorallia sp. API 0066]
MTDRPAPRLLVTEPVERSAARPPAPGAASLALRDALERPRRAARVVAVFPSAVYLLLGSGGEPRVVALVGADEGRPANSVVVPSVSGRQPFTGVAEGDEGWVGDGHVEAGGVSVRVKRWWDPRPVLGPLPAARLRHAIMTLENSLDFSTCGLAGHPGPPALAAHCAAGDLAKAVPAAERIVGLGPGLTPSGDDVLAGLLLSLRLLGSVLDGGNRAVWLAGWLAAAVTADADTRTTAPGASLLHCAAAGQPTAEAAAVLRGLAGREPLVPAVRRLALAGRNGGPDLAWGLLAGAGAALALRGEAVGRATA